MEIKEKELEVVSDALSPDFEYVKNNRWHFQRVYKINGSWNKVYVTGVTMGCGLGQIYGVVDVSEKELRAILKCLSKDYVRNGVGSFLATLGHSYIRKHEQKLLNVGFIPLASYTNHRHGTSIQKLYIFTVPTEDAFSYLKYKD